MRLLAPAIAILLLNSAAAGQNSHLSIETHEVATGAMPYDHWKTSWGSYDRTTVGTKTVLVILRNFANVRIRVTATIYFVSNGTEIGRAQHDYNFVGPGEIKSLVTAPPTVMRTLNLEALGYREVQGVAPVTNWYVIARAQRTIVAFQASNPVGQNELTAKIRAGIVR